MEWKDQYKHPQWQKKRLEVLDVAGYACERCYDNESQLHVHHKRYVKGRMIWEYGNDELSVLCSECHEITHAEKDVIGHMFASLHSSAIEDLIPLIAGYCNQIIGPCYGDMSGPLLYSGNKIIALSGMIAAEICNRANSENIDAIESLFMALENSRIYGKKFEFSISKDGD